MGRLRPIRFLAVSILLATVLAVTVLVPHPRSVPDPTGKICGRKDYELLMRFIGRDVVQCAVIGFHYLRNAVGMGPCRLREAGRWLVLVDKSEGRMTIARGDDTWRVYRCGTGQVTGDRRKDEDGRTPIGTFQVIDKAYRPFGVEKTRPPTWQVHFSTIWYPNIIVHQTSDSARLAGMGHVSEGCINLYRHDMKEFYDSVPVGARIVIRE